MPKIYKYWLNYAKEIQFVKIMQKKIQIRLNNAKEKYKTCLKPKTVSTLLYNAKEHTHFYNISCIQSIWFKINIPLL